LHVKKVFEPLYQAELTHWHKIIFPRRRKIQFKNIPDVVHVRVEDKFQKKSEAYVVRKAVENVRLDHRLQELAQTEILVPLQEMQLLKTSSTSDYGSQTNAAKYAIGSLEVLEQPLRDNGFQTEIRTVESSHRKDSYGYYYHSGRYELWANAEPWQLDVCRRRRDVLAWATACWKAGTNPKVYNPWLNDEIFEQSMHTAMYGSDINDE